MWAVITLLVLLLPMCGSQTRSTQTEVHTESQSTGAAAAAAVSTQLDVSAELRELRAMVLELRGQLTVTQNELQNTKTLLNKMLIVNYTIPNDYKIYLQMDSSCVFFTPCKAILLHLFFKQRTQMVCSTCALKKGSFICIVCFFLLTHLNEESVDTQAGSQSEQPVLSKQVVR